MKDIIDGLRVTAEKGFSLKKHDAAYTADMHKEDAAEVLAGLTQKIGEQQEKLYAANKYSLLIIFQAMDAAGKDSAIKHTMTGLDPQGCQVFSFKQPTSEDYEHDFLWRHYKALPERGRIGIHNRSHYENVLITKVHPELILNEHLPQIKDVKDIDKQFWAKRYQSIRQFEEHLTANGTVIIKFFLNVSRAEQKERFLQRIDDPGKNWKFAVSDVKERERWPDYMKAYEKAIKETATPQCPWYVIPADKKWFTRIAISTIVLHTLEKLDLQFPVLPDKETVELQAMKDVLNREG